MLDTRVHEKTKYSNIFKQTYWGSSVYDQYNDKIIENRNNLVVEYSILGKAKEPSYSTDKWFTYSNGFDHKEYYRISGKRTLVLFSSYKGYINAHREEYEERFNRLGFILINPIYLEEAESYIKIFNSRKELNSFLNDWENL